VSARGVVRPDAPTFDGDLHLSGVPLSALPPSLLSAAQALHGSLNFDGRLVLTGAGGALGALVSGRTTLAAPRLMWLAPVRRDFSADRVAVSLRRYEWPGGIAVIDSLSLTHPAWSTAMVPPLGVTVDSTGLVVSAGATDTTLIDGLLAVVEMASRAVSPRDADMPSLRPYEAR
jgi:hypothetical protein